MNIEYKIEWKGIANTDSSVTVYTELELANAIKDLLRGQQDGYFSNIKVYYRNVDDWQPLVTRDERFKPGDFVMYRGEKYTLMMLVFPEGVPTWIAITSDVGAEPTLIEESELPVAVDASIR